MSTDSGIPDYRGRDGIRRVRPMQYAEFTGSSAARQRYWARGFVGWTRFAQAAPNESHHAVARLQCAGLVDTLVTQNVDGLHSAAGSPEVTELHGSLARVVCLTCGDRTARTAVQQQMDAANPGFAARVSQVIVGGSQVSSQIRPDGDVVLDDGALAAFRPPLCRACGADTLKPDVVFFGESVPKPTVQRCLAAVESATSVLVLGSSLAVMSGYRFVLRARAAGIPVAIVTRGATRADGQAAIALDAPLRPSLRELARLLAGPVPRQAAG